MTKPLNLFVTSSYAEGGNFCARSRESETLKSQVVNGRNTVLYGARGMGKTAFIRYFFNRPEVKTDFFCFYCDVGVFRSMKDFVCGLVDAVFGEGVAVERFPSGTFGWALPAVGSMHGEGGQKLKFSLTAGITGDPDFTLGQVFKSLNTQEMPCILALDTFERVVDFKDAYAEAVIRSYVQESPNVRMIFAGSDVRCLAQIFSGPTRPFYQSADYLKLGPIERQVYEDFAVKLFRENGKELPAACFRTVYELCEGCTACVQKVMSELFVATKAGKAAGPEDVEKAWAAVVMKDSGT